MEKVINIIKQDEQDDQYISFWLSKTASERLQEVTRLRLHYFTWLNQSFPQHIEKVVTHRTL
ncbi:MAG: hypothetical protein H7Y13_08785 [Sphingobacteriaceae bacterium]|nr:hypothetical protein [Sphingobacteriaceae bacterium]